MLMSDDTQIPDAGPNLAPLAEEAQRLVLTARSIAAASLASLQVLTSFEIGRLLVDMLKYSPPGAVDGPGLPVALARMIGPQAASTLTAGELAAMRDFYLAWQDRAPAIRSGQADENSVPLALSWPHYLRLLQLAKPERDFYEIQAIRHAWPLAVLESEIEAGLYAAWAASPDPEALLAGRAQDSPAQPGLGLAEPSLRGFFGLD